MANFILVRHGQTAWNRDQRFRGHIDIELSEQGKKEAGLLADVLEKENVDYLYASPLSRAMETLTPLAHRLGKDVVPLEGIMDLSFGEWEGKPVEEIKSEYPDLYAKWQDNPEVVIFPGGEGLGEAQSRAMRAISRLAVDHIDSTIAVCSHRVICKLVMLGLLGVRPDKFWALRQDTACIDRFQYNPPDVVIVKVNETNHLTSLGQTLQADF